MSVGPAPLPASSTDRSAATLRESRSSLRRSSTMLLAGAILLPISSQLHPKVDAELDFDTGVAAMLDADTWYLAHFLELASTLLILAALWQIARTPVVSNLRFLRLAVVAAAVGCAIYVIDLIPHTLAATQTAALRAGDGSLLLDLHLLTQAIATPVLGLGVGALAVADARRSARWTWIPAGLAVVGGLVGGLAGPALLVTRDNSYANLLVGFTGIGIWLLVTAIRRFRAVRTSTDVALT